jgi:hypothetical protein
MLPATDACAVARARRCPPGPLALAACLRVNAVSCNAVIQEKHVVARTKEAIAGATRSDVTKTGAASQDASRHRSSRTNSISLSEGIAGAKA